jgi:transposase
VTTRSLAAAPAPVTPSTGIVVGVDTHSDVHVAVALDGLGRRLGELAVPTTLAGSQQLERWAGGHGPITAFGVEGSASWGANLTRYLREQGHDVIEVNRPDRSTRRRLGKSDPADAEAAARSLLAGTATATAKALDGHVEMIRSLHLVRRSAQKARRQAANQLHALVVTAPDHLRDQLRALPIDKLVALALTWRPGSTPSSLSATSKLAIRSLARRYRTLSEGIRDLDRSLTALINDVAPQLLAVKGLGAHTSAVLLIAVGDNPERLRSESAFAHLCGAAPIPASSGKTIRYRLNRGGDRQANYALYILAVTRMAWDPTTKAYVARRTTEGKTKKEIIRCLKRHIAREIYKLLTAPRPRLPVAG